MARLFKGEWEQKQKKVWNILRGSPWGITEAEASGDLRLERRTTNNYLRGLQKDGKAEKRGRRWFSKE
jgi:hypothetical protein